MKEKFERNNNLVYLVMLIASVSLLLIVIITVFSLSTVQSKLILFCASLAFAIFIAILIKMPKSYNYVIEICANCIIIEVSKKEHRALQLPFCITKVKKHFGHSTLLLDDGFEVAEIKYDKRLLKFLEELQN